METGCRWGPPSWGEERRQLAHPLLWNGTLPSASMGLQHPLATAHTPPRGGFVLLEQWANVNRGTF